MLVLWINNAERSQQHNVLILHFPPRHKCQNHRAVMFAEWEPGLMEASELGIPAQNQTEWIRKITRASAINTA